MIIHRSVIRRRYFLRGSLAIMGTFLSVLFFCVAANAGASGKERKTQVWFSAAQEGIYKALFSHKTGKFENVSAAKIGMFSDYIVQHPTLPVLYSINHNGKYSSIVAYSIEKNGDLAELSALGRLPETGAHINISADGSLLAVAYYNAGITGIYALDDDGSISETVLENKHQGSSLDKNRQRSAHPHWVGFSKNSRYLYVTDLGTDHIWVYKINKNRRKATLSHKAAMKKGSGPRHLAFHPENAFVYVADELHSTVSVYAINESNGQLSLVETRESAPENKQELWANVSDLRVHPNGKFLYVVNRGSDLVSVFAIDPENGKLKPIEREHVRGSISRNIVITDDGRWALVASVQSGSVAVFKIMPETGELKFMAYKLINVPNARSIVIDGQAS